MTSTASAHHRPRTGRQEQVGRQPRAFPAPLQGADQGRGQARDRRPRHPRHRARRRDHDPEEGHPRAGVPPRPGRRARDGAPRQPRVHPGRPHRAAAAGRWWRQRQGSGQRLGRGRRRLHLRADQGRVHAGLLRGPGAAASGAHATGRDAGVEEPPRRLHQRRHAEQPARGALDARRDRPAHRHRRGGAARAARVRGRTGRIVERRAARRRRLGPAKITALQDAHRRACAPASRAFRTSIRSTCASATASGCHRCRLRRRSCSA